MRPVNLIPPEQRRGDRAPLRAGPLSYGVVGILAAALLAIVLVVLTGNTVAERESELAGLEAEEQAARARAEAMRPYAEFASLQQVRRDTVTSLAQSRFDWERVLREFSIILPADVWLVKMTGTVSPGTVLESGAEVAIRESVPGPALTIEGCAAGQDAVARFIAALKDIDGVTRVAVQESKRPPIDASETSGAAASETGDDCRTRDFITRFQIVAAFDAAPVTDAVAPDAAPAPTAPAPADGSGVPEAEAEQQQAEDSAAEQSGDGQQAAKIVPGVAK